MSDNTADRKAIRAKEKRARLDEENDKQVLTALMSTYGGRAYVWRRLEYANVFSTVYNESPARMAFNEGIRNAGLELLNAVMSCAPDQFIQAMREANGRRTDRDTIDRNDDNPAASSEHPGGPNGDWGTQGPEPILGSGADEGSGFVEDRTTEH